MSGLKSKIIADWSSTQDYRATFYRKEKEEEEMAQNGNN